MRTLLISALLASSVSVACAADTYELDPNHTHVTFSFQHLGLSTFDGKIPASGGKLVLDRAQRTGSVEVTFSIKDVATGVAKFDDHLRSDDFFSAQKYPTATFKSTKVEFQGDKPAKVTGDLTIKDVTRPVTLEVTSFNCVDQHPMAKVPACGANATAKIKRSDFGLTYALPAVRDEIELTVEMEAMGGKP